MLILLIMVMVLLLINSRPNQEDMRYFYIRQYSKWQTFFRDVTCCKSKDLRKKLLQLSVDEYFKDGYDVFEKVSLTQRKMCYKNLRTGEVLFSFNK